MKSITASIAIATVFIVGNFDSARAGSIVVENRGTASFEIAMTVVSPGERTLTENVMGVGLTAGTLASDVPAGISWELLVWKRALGNATWTFSTAFTIGRLPDDSGRTYLLIDPAQNRVTQAVMNQRDPAPELLPLPPMIPAWSKSDSNNSRPSPSPITDSPPCSDPWTPYPLQSGYPYGPMYFEGTCQFVSGYPVMRQEWNGSDPTNYRPQVRQKRCRRR